MHYKDYFHNSKIISYLENGLFTIKTYKKVLIYLVCYQTVNVSFSTFFIDFTNYTKLSPLLIIIKSITGSCNRNTTLNIDIETWKLGMESILIRTLCFHTRTTAMKYFSFRKLKSGFWMYLVTTKYYDYHCLFIIIINYV